MIYYVDTNLALSNIISAPNDTILLKSGVVFDVSAMPAGLIDPQGITVGAYGTGAKPVLNAGVIRSDFTLDGTGLYKRSYASNVVGNVLEDGRPMTWVDWQGSAVATAAVMTAGSFCFDSTGLVLYIKQSSGLPSSHVYSVSETLQIMRTSVPKTGLTVDGIELRQASRHAFLMYATKNLRVTNVDVNVAGGIKVAGISLGNGFEISYGCNNAYIGYCTWTDIFDAGATTQLYEATPQLLTDHVYEKNTAIRCGMNGIEISTQANNQFIKNVDIVDCAVTSGGLGWSGDRNGGALNIISNFTSSSVTNVNARRFSSTANRRMFLDFNSNGLNSFLDSSGVSSRLGVVSAGNIGTLIKNVTDNGVAVSGGNMIQSTALAEPPSKMISAFKA